MILTIISIILFIISVPLDVARMALTARRLATKAAKKVGKVAGKAAGKAGIKTPEIKSKSAKQMGKFAGKAAEFALRRMEDALRLAVIILRCATGIFAVIAFFVMLFMVFLLLVLVGGVAGYVAMSDGNLLGPGGGRHTSMGGASDIGRGGATDMEGVVKMFGEWLISDVAKYYDTDMDDSTDTNIERWPCPLLDDVFGGEGKGHMRPDCTGLAAAVVRYAYNDKDAPCTYSGDMVDPNGTFATYVKSKGYADVYVISTDNVNVNDLRPGDMLVYRGSTSGHAEFYIGPNLQFGWGGVQDHYPIQNEGWTRCGTYIANSPAGGGHSYTVWYKWKDITNKASGGGSSSSSDDEDSDSDEEDSNE